MWFNPPLAKNISFDVQEELWLENGTTSADCIIAQEGCMERINLRDEQSECDISSLLRIQKRVYAY
jgi:hypothetical protein